MLADCLTEDLLLSSYQYTLPPELIAKYPLPERDSSRMMVLDRNTGEWEHQFFTDFPNSLEPGDVLVINNVKVLPARLYGNRKGYTGRVEALLLNPASSSPDSAWVALMRPAKKLEVGTVVELEESSSTLTILKKEEQGRFEVALTLNDANSVADLLEKYGHMPLPPYLNRAEEPEDKERYQTVYAKNFEQKDLEPVKFAQAAPTAGLHFTPQVLEAIKARGVNICEVTLAVGAGTFRPVVSDDITAHRMDAEWYDLPQATVNAVLEAKRQGKRIICVGTTATKTLETAARNQNGQLCKAESGWSDHFIYPGVPLKVVDGLLTNFHLPESTLLMLISTFASRKTILAAYEEAVAQRYRFYSYGDCMLLL